MPITQLLTLFCSLLALGLLGHWLARWWRLPLGGVLALLGFLVSEGIVAAGYDTGLRWDSFHDLLLYVFVPILVFRTALRFDPGGSRKFVRATLILSLPLLILSIVIATMLLYWLVGHAQGFPWIAAAIAATLFMATDSFAITQLLERHKIGAPVTTLLEGESIVGDTLVIALFITLIEVATTASSLSAPQTLSNVFVQFAVSALGGGLIGGGVAWVITRWLKQVTSAMVRATILLLVVYSSYLFAELVIGASGVVALMIIGIRCAGTLERDEFVLKLWQFLGRTTYTIIFLLVGVTITISMFTERWLAMLLAIAAVLLARVPVAILLARFGVSDAARNAHGKKVAPAEVGSKLGSSGLSGRQFAVVYFGGVRGAVTVALALALPAELPYWWTIQSMAYGVVLFSLLVQAPVIGLLLNKSKDSL